MSRSAAKQEECRASPTQYSRASPIHCSRASPVQWSESSDNSSEEEDDSQQQHRIILSDNHVEEDADIHPSQRCLPESPLLKRRPLRQFDETIKDRSRQAYAITTAENVKHVSKPRSEIVNKSGADVLFRRNNVVRKSEYIFSDHLLSPILTTAVVLIVVCVISFVYFERSSALNANGLIPLNSKDLIRRVKEVLINFKNIPADAVVKFSAGIRSILESDPTKPSVFVVLYNDTGHGSYCLSKAIASLAMQYMGSSERDPLIVNPRDLLKDENMMKDYGSILEKYKPLVEKHRSTIISDLQYLPGKMALAFHFFCDAYDPVVQKALYIFTLQMRYNNSAREIEQVESRMHELWRNEISDDQRQALITRLTEEIISLPSDVWHSEKCPQ